MATEITQRVSAAWRNWKRCSGVLCDRRMPVKLKGKVYKTVVRPALLYGAVTWATMRGQEARLEVNETRMLRWMCSVTRRNHIQNEHIRETTRVVQTSKKITEQRLKWCGYVRRMKGEHIVRRMLDVDIPVQSRRGHLAYGPTSIWGVKPSFAQIAKTTCLSLGPAREKKIIMNYCSACF